MYYELRESYGQTPLALPVYISCSMCGTLKSSIWRHPKTPAYGREQIAVLCNACGIRYNRFLKMFQSNDIAKSRLYNIVELLEMVYQDVYAHYIKKYLADKPDSVFDDWPNLSKVLDKPDAGKRDRRFESNLRVKLWYARAMLEDTILGLSPPPLAAPTAFSVTTPLYSAVYDSEYRPISNELRHDGQVSLLGATKKDIMGRDFATLLDSAATFHMADQTKLLDNLYRREHDTEHTGRGLYFRVNPSDLTQATCSFANTETHPNQYVFQEYFYTVPDLPHLVTPPPSSTGGSANATPLLKLVSSPALLTRLRFESADDVRAYQVALLRLLSPPPEMSPLPRR